MKKSFFDDDKYTKIALSVETEVVKSLELIVEKYANEGYSVRELQILMNNAVSDVILLKMLTTKKSGA